MSINSLNPVSPVFKGRTLPRFVNSHYINIDHSRAYSVFLHKHVHHLELYMVLEGQARYFQDDQCFFSRHGASEPGGEQPDHVSCTIVREGLQSNSQRTIQADHISEYRLAKEIQSYLDENYRNGMNLDDIFDKLHLSVSYAAAIFKKYFNVSPKKYILEHRLGEAQQMLQSTDLSVADIAERTGFNSPNHANTSAVRRNSTTSIFGK